MAQDTNSFRILGPEQVPKVLDSIFENAVRGAIDTADHAVGELLAQTFVSPSDVLSTVTVALGQIAAEIQAETMKDKGSVRLDSLYRGESFLTVAQAQLVVMSGYDERPE